MVQDDGLLTWGVQITRSRDVTSSGIVKHDVNSFSVNATDKDYACPCLTIRFSEHSVCQNEFTMHAEC